MQQLVNLPDHHVSMTTVLNNGLKDKSMRQVTATDQQLLHLLLSLLQHHLQLSYSLQILLPWLSIAVPLFGLLQTETQAFISPAHQNHCRIVDDDSAVIADTHSSDNSDIFSFKISCALVKSPRILCVSAECLAFSCSISSACCSVSSSSRILYKE